MKKRYSIFYIINIFLFLIACHENKNDVKYIQTLDLEFNCEEVLYSEGEGFAVLFKVLYSNKSDYTVLFYKNAPKSLTSEDANIKGFLLVDNLIKNNIVLKDFEKSKNFVSLKPKTDDFFYLFMFNQYGKEQLEKNLKNCYILYNGGDLKNIPNLYFNEYNKKKVLLFNMKGIKIDLFNAKLIPVNSDEELMKIYDSN